MQIDRKKSKKNYSNMLKKPCKWTGKYVNEYGQEQINGKQPYK